MSHLKLLDPHEYLSDEECEELERLGLKLINWGGMVTVEGAGQGLEFMNSVKEALNSSRSVVCCVVGRPGIGKTYAALRLAEIFDKRFTVDQVLFTREEILEVVSGVRKLRPKSCVIIDESHIALGNRNWAVAAQKSLVELFQSVRHLGLLIFVVCLHPTTLDVQIRNFLISYQLHSERPGVTTPYATSMGRFSDKLYTRRMETLKLRLPGGGSCNYENCLQCEHITTCNNIRAQYERKKRAYLRGIATETIHEVTDAHAKATQRRLSVNDYLAVVKEHTEDIVTNRVCNTDAASVKRILSAQGHAPSDSICHQIAKAYDIEVRSSQQTTQTTETTP